MSGCGCEYLDTAYITLLLDLLDMDIFMYTDRYLFLRGAEELLV